MKIQARNQYNFKGWSPKTKAAKRTVADINKLISNPGIKTIAIAGHRNPDGDAIGSTLAMGYLIFQKLRIKPDVYVFGETPKRFEYLNNTNKITLIKSTTDFPDKEYDLAISVDVPQTKLIPTDFFNNIFKKAKKTINVDHHIVKDEFADINFIDSSSSSAAQVVMQLVKAFGINPKSLPEEFNNAVYTGLVTDSKSFSVATNGNSFKDAALLVENGLDIEKVTEQTYSNIPQEIQGLINLAKQKVKFSKDGKLVYLYSDQELEDYKAKISSPQLEYDIRNRLKDLTNDLRKTEGVEISISLTPEIKDGEKLLYVSGRSNAIDINETTESYSNEVTLRDSSG